MKPSGKHPWGARGSGLELLTCHLHQLSDQGKVALLIPKVFSFSLLGLKNLSSFTDSTLTQEWCEERCLGLWGHMQLPEGCLQLRNRRVAGFLPVGPVLIQEAGVLSCLVLGGAQQSRSARGLSGCFLLGRC